MTFQAGASGLGVATDKIRIFVSYDREHDEDLHDLLVEQASRSASRFQISGRSRGRAPEDLSDQWLHHEIRKADQVIVICGEHTDSSERMGTELLIAQVEERPYFLLWGRRPIMCTRPPTARASDSMYSWTWEILQDQILSIVRDAQSKDRLTGLKRAKAAPKS